MKKKSILKCLALLLSSLLLVSCDFFKAGSYPNAEYYTFDISCDSLISEISKFKIDNPQYKIIVNNIETKDRIDNNNFYHASFYLKEENIIVYNIINMYQKENNMKRTNIGWDSILDNFGTDSAKFIQTKDIPKEKKELYKQKLEIEIFNKLGRWNKEK